MDNKKLSTRLNELIEQQNAILATVLSELDKATAAKNESKKHKWNSDKTNCNKSLYILGMLRKLADGEEITIAEYNDLPRILKTLADEKAAPEYITDEEYMQRRKTEPGLKVTYDAKMSAKLGYDVNKVVRGR